MMARDGRRLWPEQPTIRVRRTRRRRGERKFWDQGEKKETEGAWHNQGLSSDANLRFSRMPLATAPPSKIDQSLGSGSPTLQFRQAARVLLSSITRPDFIRSSTRVNARFGSAENHILVPCSCSDLLGLKVNKVRTKHYRRYF